MVCSRRRVMERETSDSMAAHYRAGASLPQRLRDAIGRWRRSSKRMARLPALAWRGFGRRAEHARGLFGREPAHTRSPAGRNMRAGCSHGGRRLAKTPGGACAHGTLRAVIR